MVRFAVLVAVVGLFLLNLGEVKAECLVGNCFEPDMINALITRDEENRIFRTIDIERKYHQYHLSRAEANNAVGHTDRGYVGYYVNASIYNALKPVCPELRKAQLIQYEFEPKLSYFSLKEGSATNWKPKGSFYCAPREGYCGANYEMVQINSREGSGFDDYLVPISNYERITALSDEVPEYEDEINRSICWIWK